MENLRASTNPASLRELNHALNTHSNISSETFLIREIQDIMDELNSILQVYKEQSAVVTLLEKEYCKKLNLTKEPGWKNTAVHPQEQEPSTVGLTARDPNKETKRVDELIEAWVDADPLRAIEERRLEFVGLMSQAECTYNAVSHFDILSDDYSLLIVFFLT